MTTEGLKIIISAEIDKVKTALEEGKKKVNSFKEQVEKASKDVDGNLAKAGESIKSGMKAAAVGIAAAGTALLALGASTAEYRAEQAKLKTAFESAGGSAETAKETYNDLYRVLGDGGQATEAAAHLAKLTTEEKALNEWTTICQGVYATFGDSLPIEGLAEAANETAKTGALTGNLADALNWAGVNEDKFNEQLAACNNEAEREKLIRETLNGLYTEAAANYEKNNADVLAQNEAQAQLNESLGKLGETVAPIITMLTQLASEVLAELTPYIQEFADKYLPTIKDVLGGILEGLGKAIKFLLEHKAILVTLATVFGVVATAIGIYNAVAAIKAALDAAQVTTIWGLVAAHIAQAAAAMVALAPYILIVAAIAAVIAIIILCIKYWDEIVAALKVAIKKMMEILEAIVKFIWDKVLKPILNFYIEVYTAIWNGIVKVFSKVADFFGDAFKKAASAIKNAFSGIVNFFTGIWDKIKNIFSKVGTSIADAISSAVKKAVNAVLTLVVNRINGFIGAINAAIGLINKIPNVNISKVSKLEVPKLAKGGIIDSATLAVVGEQGKEAVVPLENNLAWLDKLATMLNDRMGGGAPIVLQVEGKTFAQIAVDNINQLTRQTGKLPLKVF